MDQPWIVIDTREQKPWEFPGELTVRRKLETGDYSVAGLEDLITIERKSVEDYVSTLMQGKARFVRELKRMRAFPFRAVVVEGELPHILLGRYRSNADPEAVLGWSCSLAIDYKTPVVFAGNVLAAERYATRFLHMAAKRAGGSHDASS